MRNNAALKPLVSIIVLNYNGRQFVSKCLRSLSGQTYRNFEVIFVDNASTDCSVEHVRKIRRHLGIPRLRIIVSGVNLGFCGGINLGIRYARGEYIVLLNVDTYLAPSWLEELVKAVASDERIGICQSKIVYPDFRINTTGNLCDFYGSTACRGVGEIDKCQYDKSQENFFFASGASLLIKKKVLEDIGLLDEKLFLYYDDVDLSWRARLKGYSICYIPTSLCVHFESSSVRQFKEAGLLAFYYNQRNKVRVLLKNYGLLNVVKRVPIALSVSLIESINMSVKRRDSRIIFMFLKALVWNMCNLKDTLRERKHIQKLRTVSDEQIERFMRSPPFIIESVKKKWGNAR